MPANVPHSFSYLKEPQLNCILNTEDRNTQPDLFTEENVDIVDYFETGCPTNTGRLRSSRRLLRGRRRFSARKGKTPHFDTLKTYLLRILLWTVVGHLREAPKRSVFNRASRVKQEMREKQTDDDSSNGVLGEWSGWTSCDRNSDGPTSSIPALR